MKKTAGILLYRLRSQQLEVLLVHPGGPFWKKKDAGAWSIPKGELDGDEEPLSAALRELGEETGLGVKTGPTTALTPVKSKGGKLILAWAMKGNLDASTINSNLFEMEWPPRSGKQQSFPEIDQAAWFTIDKAKEKINAAQIPLLDELADLIR